MNDFLELAKARFSCRSFSDKLVEDDKLAKILEAGRIAPTAKNYQPQKIYIIKSKDGLEKINQISPCIYGAPQVIAIGYDTNVVAAVPDRGNYNFGEMDSSIVLTHMMLEAFELGVDSCWVGRFIPEQAEKILGLPENVKLTALMPFGYAKEGTVPADRHLAKKELSEMVEYL